MVIFSCLCGQPSVIYFRVFDEYPKIDFFVWRENAKKIFSNRICTCICHILFHENFFFLLEFYFLFQKIVEITKNRREKIVEKFRMGKNDAWKILCDQSFFYFSISRVGKI